jgi:hypothetical protein
MYYLIGYNPTNAARDGKFRKIQVKMAQGPEKKGLRVRARKGYYAPSEGKTAFTPKPGAPDPEFQAAVDSPFDRNDIPLRMTSYVFDETLLGKSQAVIATDLDVRSLTFEERENRFYDTVEFLMVVAHRETGEFFRYDQKIEMKLQAATRDKLQKTWFPVVRDFELKPGGYQAKMVVRETRTGEVGTVLHEFVVPGFDALRVSTPVVSDALATEPPVDGAPGSRLEVIVRREFPVGADVYCQIDVFGAATDGPTGMPRVFQAYSVLRPDGTQFTGASPSEIRPTSLGALSRVSGFSLEGAEPGDYELEMKVWDELAAKGVVVRETFVVVPAELEPRASGGR